MSCCCYWGRLRIVEAGCPDVFVRHLDVRRGAAAVIPGQTVMGDAGHLTVDEGNVAVAQRDDVRDELIKALKGAAGFIRYELGRAVDLRATPQLLFEADRNMEYAQHIGEILSEEGRKLNNQPEEDA